MLGHHTGVLSCKKFTKRLPSWFNITLIHYKTLIVDGRLSQKNFCRLEDSRLLFYCALPVSLGRRLGQLCSGRLPDRDVRVFRGSGDGPFLRWLLPLRAKIEDWRTNEDGDYLLLRMDRSVSLVWVTGITTLSLVKSSESDKAMLIFSFFCFLMVIVFSRRSWCRPRHWIVT
jgi:hypothetical protein